MHHNYAWRLTESESDAREGALCSHICNISSAVAIKVETMSNLK